MSRRRITTTGADGRLVTRWEDAPELAIAAPALFEPAYPPQPIERRYVTPQPRNGHHRPTSPAYDTAARIARSRANGTKRSVEGVLARRGAQEDPAMPDPSVVEPTALERLATAARAAQDALEERTVAEEAWDIAQKALADAWAEVRGIVAPDEHRLVDLDASLAEYRAERQVFVDALQSRADAAAESLTESLRPARRARRRQPGHHPATAGEAREKAERAERVMAAIARNGGDKRKAAAELGMKLNAVVMVAKHASPGYRSQP